MTSKKAEQSAISALLNQHNTAPPDDADQSTLRKRRKGAPRITEEQWQEQQAKEDAAQLAEVHDWLTKIEKGEAYKEFRITPEGGLEYITPSGQFIEAVTLNDIDPPTDTISSSMSLRLEGVVHFSPADDDIVHRDTLVYLWRKRGGLVNIWKTRADLAANPNRRRWTERRVSSQAVFDIIERFAPITRNALAERLYRESDGAIWNKTEKDACLSKLSVMLSRISDRYKIVKRYDRAGTVFFMPADHPMASVLARYKGMETLQTQSLDDLKNRMRNTGAAALMFDHTTENLPEFAFRVMHGIRMDSSVFDVTEAMISRGWTVLNRIADASLTAERLYNIMANEVFFS